LLLVALVLSVEQLQHKQITKVVPVAQVVR
jgi:hypothetical protein